MPRDPEATSEIDRAVLEIVDLMTPQNGAPPRWPTINIAEFADAHGVTPSTVRNWSQQASRHIRLSLFSGGRDQIVDAFVAGIEAVKQQALAARTTIMRRNPDGTAHTVKVIHRPALDSALRAYELQMKVLGVLDEAVHHHHHHETEFDGWSADEIQFFIDHGKPPPGRREASATTKPNGSSNGQTKH